MLIYLPSGRRELIVLNVKALVGAFNLEEVLIGTFSVIVTLETSGRIV